MLSHIVNVVYGCAVVAVSLPCVGIAVMLMSPLSEYAPEMMKSIRLDVPTGLERIRGSDSTNKC